MLCAWQPLNAVFRPHPPAGGWGGGGKPLARVVWEETHKNLGRALLVLAIVESFMGLDRLGGMAA